MKQVFLVGAFLLAIGGGWIAAEISESVRGGGVIACQNGICYQPSEIAANCRLGCR